MFQCVNEHTVCMDESVKNFEEWRKTLSEADREDRIDRYEVPEEMCPICSMISFSNQDLKGYLLKKYGIPEADVFALIKESNKRRKKLYDSEYVMHVITKNGISMESLVCEIREKYKTYSDFIKDCY